MRIKSSGSERILNILTDEKRIEFLYKAISDAQELIQFTDSKTAFSIAVVAAVLAVILAQAETLIGDPGSFSFATWLALAIVLILMFLCILVIVRILRPTNNPLANVKRTEAEEPELKFYLPLNEYGRFGAMVYPFVNRKQFKLSESLPTYQQSLQNADVRVLMYTLSLELLKVSYIRNIKNDRLRVLVRLLTFLGLAFVIYYVIFSIDLAAISHSYDWKKHLISQFQG